MNFATKLLLAILACATRAQLNHCSQAQTTPMAIDQGTPATSAEQKQAVAQAVLQATGKEIVERDPKRQTICSEEEAKKENEDPELQAALDLMPKELLSWYECGMKAFKLKHAKASLDANRGSVLYELLYKLLDPMPKELILIILGYEAPKFYFLQGISDCKLKICLLQKSTLDVIIPLSNSAFAMGFSDGTLSIDQETGPQGKNQWELQTIQAHTKAITAIVDLPFQRIATGSSDGDLKIWELHKKKLQYTCIKTIKAGMKIKKMAVLPNGNIVIAGESLTKPDDADGVYICDPQRQTLEPLKILDEYRQMGILDGGMNIGALFATPEGSIILAGYEEADESQTRVFKQAHKNERWIESTSFSEGLEADTKSIGMLPDNRIIMLTLFDEKLQQIYIWNPETNTTTVWFQQLVQYNQVRSITVLLDGRIALAFNDHIDICNSNSDQIGERFSQTLEPRGKRDHLITLPDGRLLAASKDGTIQIWR